MKAERHGKKVAVIGVGNMGRLHARNYAEIRECDLVAVADPDERAGREVAQKYDCEYYSSYGRMLAEAEIDAVSVAVPTAIHKSVALDVIRAGKAVLLEKPIAPSIEEAKEIIGEARRHNVKLAIGHVERFNPAVNCLKRTIEDGVLGEVISVVVKRVGLFPSQVRDVNVVVDLAIHDIDILNYIFGVMPNTVFASGGKAVTNLREDHSEIFLLYRNVACFIETNWITPIKIRSLSVTGTKGYAELNYITQKLELYKSNYEKAADDFGEFIVKFGEPDKVGVEIDNKEPLKVELTSFLAALDGDEGLMVTGEEGLRALEVALKAVESLRLGRPIDLRSR